MKITCNIHTLKGTKIHQIALFPDPDNDNQKDEFFLAPESMETSNLRELTIYDSSLSTETQIHFELAKCTDYQQIVAFSEKYGTLVNPFNFASNDPHRNFPGLKDIIENATDAIYGERKDPEIKHSILSLSHFSIYQNDMAMLIFITRYLKDVKKYKLEFIYRCQIFFLQNSFFDLLCLEYDNVFDNIDKTLKSTPICYLRYLIASSDSEETLNDILNKSLVDVGLDKSIINCLFKIIKYDDFANPDSVREKELTQIAKLISTDLLKFHLHDTNFFPICDKQQFEQPDCQFCFPCLASAIFFYYYIDGNSIDFRICANPRCNKVFCCKKNSTQKYCDSRCSGSNRQSRYRTSKKRTNIPEPN